MASVTFPILGHRIEIVSEDPRALRLASEVFDAWLQLAPSLVSPLEPARVDIEVDDGRTASLSPHADWRRDGSIFEGRMGATRVRIDVDARVAHCITNETALSDQDWFSWHVLSPARLLATLDDRMPIHAAGVMRGERLALLMGPSGSGKSTTAYACRAAGLDVLSEDTVFFSRVARRIWGHTDTYYLAPDADRWFPEIVNSPVGRRPNGKLRRAVSADCRSPRLSIEAEPVVVLIDCSSVLRCQPVPPTEWHAYLERPLESGFDVYATAWVEAGPHLRRWRAFRLGTRSSPAAAAAEIAELLAQQM